MKLYKHMALFLAALLATVPVLGGCAPSVGGNDYAVSGAQGGYDVQYGTVQSVRMVKINNESDGKTAVGAVGGGVLDASHMNYHYPALSGVPFAALAVLLLVLYSVRYERRGRDENPLRA